MPIKQDNRSLAIKTALGPDVLAVRSISVREEISRLFQIEAELSSEDAEVDFDQVIGKEVTIRLDVAAKEKRYFAGIVSRLVQVANQDGYAHYRATIVPWLWLLTRTSDCRIFLDKTVPQIIEEVFNDHDRKDYQLKLSGNYEKKEYCVQYRETDFNFISRLMEQEGIYYYFEHKDGKHTMVLADAISAHKPFKGYEEIAYHELDKSAPNREVVTGWTMEKEVQPVAYALNDFDFKKPKAPLKTSSSINRNYGMAQSEIYDYPGEYIDHGDGERLADVRLNELQSQYEILHGQATARGLVAGCTFKLKYHPRRDQNREYLITGTSMEIDAGEFGAGSGSGGGEFFSCSCTAIEKAQQFRPARITPKPIVQGPQTAIVVGPGGEEIYTDEHARVKVHFHWDRYDKRDENSSCWIRVSQYWAGKEWGTIHIPRMGQEVIVEFLEGDPDRPIITGRVYNGEQVPPYGLPANKTQSGMKSRSSKGGSGGNFNEIRFEDKKGSEQLYVHAEKNQDNVVENDETTEVGHDRTEHVGHDEKITIDNNRTEKVGVNEDITIGSNRTEKVGVNEDITIGSNRTEKVGVNETIAVGADRTRTVGKSETITVALMRTHTVGVNEAITVGAAQEITVGAAQAITVGGVQANTIGVSRAVTVGTSQTVKIGTNLSEDIGGNHMENVGAALKIEVGKDGAISVGKNLSLVAGEQIVIKTGDASITMKKDGSIQIKGKDIKIEGSGKIVGKAGSDMVLKGSSKVTIN